MNETTLYVGLVAMMILGGCVNTCPESERYVDGRCQNPCPPGAVVMGDRCVTVDAAVPDAGDGGRPDASDDGGDDLGGDDLGTDAGPCGMECPAGTPVCDVTSGACVECNGADATECTGGTPVCDIGTSACVQCTSADATACAGATPVCDVPNGVCVACLTNTDCATTGLAECSIASHTCVGCMADAACNRFAPTPVCDEGAATCVACTGDTEAARCGAFSCRQSDGTCTTTMRASLGTCDACQADSECATGRRCVEHFFMGTSTGSFCFLDAAMGGCGDTDSTRRPYRTRSMLTSVDGVDATYCMPPILTTCAGIRDTQSTSCTVSTMCGVAGLADGYCPTIGTGAGLCSYECGGAVDCRFTLNCGDTPAHCRP